MTLTIQKWGNSAAIRLPAALMARAGLTIGDKVDPDVELGLVKLVAAKPKYSLENLVAECNPSAPIPADMQAWEAMQPVGREVD